MIRRHVGDQFWLITQHEHALLSGRLAAAIGGAFAPLSERAVRGIALHDCGWPLHDDAPTLNSAGLPLDVFESPRTVAMAVWPESARRAAQEDPYAGLLVSLHALSLSIMASTPTPFAHEKFDLADPTARFELNRFQQSQVELQEHLRQKLRLRVDRPRVAGLAVSPDDDAERQLTYDFRLLQAMDKLSLGICCTQPPADIVSPMPNSPGGDDLPIRLTRDGDFDLLLRPWPFAEAKVTVQAPFRRVLAMPFAAATEYHKALAAASAEQFSATLRPH